MSKPDVTLLLVDDDAQALEAESSRLRKQGYGVICVRSTEEAIEVVHRCNDLVIAAVISDRFLPDISGRDLLSVLRRSRPALPAVLVSRSLPEERARQGGVGYLARPYDPHELEEAMNEALRACGAKEGTQPSVEDREGQRIKISAGEITTELAEAALGSG